jgi:hypothetical protein
MTSENIETYFEDGAWRNWVDGEQLGPPHPDRDGAIAEARDVARDRGLEHIIRDEEATVVRREDHAGE